MSDLDYNEISNSLTIEALLGKVELGQHNSVFSSDHWFSHDNLANHISFTAIDEKNTIQNLIHFKISQKLGLMVSELAGEPYIQYNDAVVNSNQPIDGYLEHVTSHLKSKNVDAVYFHNVRQDAHIYDYCLRHGIVIEQKQAPWIDLSKFENYTAYFNSCSATIRKVYRRLHREYETEFRVYLDQEITENIIEEIIDLKAKQLARLGKSSRVFMDIKNLEKLVKIFTSPTKDFKIFASVIKCDGKLVAGAMSLIKGDTYYGYIVAMDDEYTKFGPGNAHVLMNVNWCYERGLTKYDFLSPADDYKLKWAKNNSTAVYDMVIPLSERGKLYASIYLKKVRPILKKYYLFASNNRLVKYLNNPG